jgi:hypothetical protein
VLTGYLSASHGGVARNKWDLDEKEEKEEKADKEFFP